MRIAGMRMPRWAVFFQVLLAVYLQVVEWVPLGRWNNVAQGNGQAATDIILAVLQAAILAFYWKCWKWAMLAGLILYGFWTYMEVASWWVPYIRGGSPAMMRFYNHWFSHTYKLLPPIGDHPIPDAEHTVILILLVLVLTFSVRATRQSFVRLR